MENNEENNLDNEESSENNSEDNNEEIYRICECCNEEEELVAWIEKTKDREGNLIFSIDCVYLWRFDECRENKTTEQFQSEEDFRLAFPWVKTIYNYEPEYYRASMKIICQDCMDRLFMDRTLELVRRQCSYPASFRWCNLWLSGGDLVMFPTYTSCCQKLYLRNKEYKDYKRRDNQNLFIMHHRNNFPYQSFWYHLYTDRYYFCDLPFANDDNGMVVCEDCMKQYPCHYLKYSAFSGFIKNKKKMIEKNIDVPISLDADNRMFYEADEIDYYRYKPVYYLKELDKKHTIENIDNYYTDNITKRSLQNAIQIKRELAEYFRKKEILRIAKNNLNLIRKKYFICKDVLNLIVKKCYP